MFGILFDDAGNPKLTTQALELTSKLQNIVDSLKTPQNSLEGLLSEIGTITRGNHLIADLKQLGGNIGGVSLQINDDPAIPLSKPRKKTDQHYNFQQNNTKNKRQKDNIAAVELVRQYNAGEITLDSITDEQKDILGRYTGNGGNLLDVETGMRGSDYEYYTPKPIASGIWDVLNDMGFGGGKVLDPCAGVGIFGATAPLNAAIDAVELDKTSGTINKLINESDSYNVRVSNFESVASRTPDESYDAIVANVPFGSNRGRNFKYDEKYQKASLEYYFIMRSLEKLKGGGLAAFLVPDRCMTGKSSKERALRQDSSLLGEFLGAYRLPNKVFGAAAADTITCVMFYRKHSKAALEKVSDLYSGGEAKTLSDAQVLWDSFVDGKYFETSEGKKRVLGDDFIKAEEGDKYGRDQLTSSEDILAIAKRMLVHKLPKTRIDWALLDETEAFPISYNEGDTITQRGQTLQLVNGNWVVLNPSPENNAKMDLLSDAQDPYSAFVSNITIEQVDELADHMKKMSMALDMPPWMGQMRVALAGGKTLDQRKQLYKPILIGMCVKQIMDEEGLDSGTNFKEKYQDLSAEMERYASDANKVKGVEGEAKLAILEYKKHYKKGTGFSSIWLGEIRQVTEVEMTPDASLDGVIYVNKSPWFTVEQARASLGPDFDPFKDPEYCLSDDGNKICRSDDYYVGNLGEFLKRIDPAIENAANDSIRNKLLAQKKAAFERVTKIDVQEMHFNLFSPYVTIEEKAEFLRRSVHASARVVDVDGEKTISFNVTSSEKDKNNRAKYIGRLESYLKHGNVSLQGIKIEGISEEKQLEELRSFINKTNDKFNSYVRSNTRITNRLESTANDPKNMRFKQLEDTKDLIVQGMNPELKLHTYQRAFVRKMSRDFSGINGFDVGLGKTFTALASVQYVQSIGVKKRTMFVVPGSVLSNWRKEALRAYKTIDDCLFVGLRENGDGNLIADSKYYDEDLMSIVSNKPNKIFISFEAFERIKLKAETIEHFENHIRSVDASFMEDDSRKNEEKTQAKLEGLTAILSKKTGAAPYLEQLGIDSIVIDEAHAYKNSSAVREFKGGKYLSTAGMSGRGIDAQCKAWFIRGMSDRKDGVLLLTATPITNSPLEVYSMMSLAVGHERVNSLAMGVSGADDFMNAVCVMEDEQEESIDGQMSNKRIFKGLSNPAMLRNLISDVATIKTADDVGAQIVVPDEDTQETIVTLDKYSQDKLDTYKNAYRYAMDLIRDRALPFGPGVAAYDYVKQQFGEKDDVIAHPFNLINKMTMLIADPDLDKQYTKYVIGQDQKEALDKVLAEWDKKRPKEDRGRISPHTQESDYSLKIKKNKDTGEETAIYTIQVRAWADNANVYLDSTDWKTQEAFETLAEKHGLGLDCVMSPKMAAMIDNLKRENSHVRGVNAQGEKAPYAKQIVFCDILGIHNKMRKLIAKHLGVSASQIAIVTGQRNNDAAEILEIQNNFNDYGEDNYRIIIANKKAEVGINLQIGTQAIHHYTIGWTPDSLQQRNGRGVRQGNKTEKVTVYHYDAQGTFDAAKRTLVNNKADWIGELMDGQGSESIKIVGGMSNEQIRALAEFAGGDALEAMQAEIARNEKMRHEKENVERQKALLETAKQQQDFLDKNKDFSGWVKRDFDALMQTASSVGKLERLIKKENDLKADLAEIVASSGSVKDVQAKLNNIEKSKLKLENEMRQANKLMARIAGAVNAVVANYNFEQIAPDKAAYVINKKFRERAEQPHSKATLTDTFYDHEDGVRYGVKVKAKEEVEGSELYNEWSFEVDSAAGLIRETVKQFKERAKVDNSINERVIDDFIGEDRNGQISPSGVLFSKSCFLVKNNDPKQAVYYFTGVPQENQYGSKIKGLINGERTDTEFNYDFVDQPEYSVAYPDSALYTQCCIALAEYEDSLVGTVSTKEGNLFSDVMPDILKYRKGIIEIAFEYANSYLQGHYYPYVMNAHEPDKLSDFEKAVVKQQSEIVLRHTKYHFYVLAENEHLITKNRPTIGNKTEVIRDFCLANNVKASVSDLPVSFKLSVALANYIREGDAKDRLFTFIDRAKFETVAAFREALAQVVCDEFTPFIHDMEPDTSIMLDVVDRVYEVSNIYRTKQAEILAIEKAAQAINAPEVQEPQPIDVTIHEPDIEPGAIPKTAIIRVETNGFNTLPYREKFREYSDEIQNATSYAKPDHWSKYNKRFSNASACWNKPLKQWEIPYGAWQLFEQRDSELTDACTFTVIYGGV
ncbi:SNF2-related protein [Acinetobacter lwoffii]|uniref:SNF2-related protein n=1 Tax=Acinetobacter lwoffii TaxID=28090 RepID=UPI00209B7CA7|nr:SNF2-related protein [Acinetobacter lwoffii]MCO8114604.1 SNF2-related protein [Acinetobacter lwoffii]